MLNYNHPKKQGDVGMGIAIGWFASKGCTVCIPLTDSQDYDLIVEIKNKLKKIQIRTTRFIAPSKSYSLNLRVCGGNRSGKGKVKKFDPKKVEFLQ